MIPSNFLASRRRRGKTWIFHDRTWKWYIIVVARNTCQNTLERQMYTHIEYTLAHKQEIKQILNVRHV